MKLSFLLMVSLTINAKTVEESVCLSASGSDRCSVAVKRYTSDKSMWLDAPNNSVPGELTNILSNYYSAAKSNDIKRLTALFASEDGSRKGFQDEIRKNPTQYAGFYKVKRVRINQLARIGDYYMVGVEWFDEDQKSLATWTELALCSAGCLMSNQLFSRNLLVEFANIVVAPGTPYADDIGGYSISYPDGSNFSGVFSFRANTDVKLIASRFKAISGLAEMFRGRRGGFGGEKFMVDIVNAISPYWNQPDVTDYSYLPNPGSKGRPFSGHALNNLASVFARTTDVSPVMLVKGNEVDFVFFNMRFSDSDQRLAFLAVGPGGKIVPQIQLNPKDGIIAQAFQTSVIYRYVQQQFMP